MCGYLRERGVRPRRILEPTCGAGSFLAAAAQAFPDAVELMGLEYQSERYGSALRALCAAEPRLAISFGDAYAIDFRTLPWRERGPLTVLGNLPWVTTAALGRVAAGAPQPPRTNPKGLKGLDARTGAANFDVAEFLIIKLLREIGAPGVSVALLVKESVARNVIAAAPDLGIALDEAEIVRIDARRWFGVSVNAALLHARLGAGGGHSRLTMRDDFDGPAVRLWPVPPAKGRPASAALTWRQGIKHDAAAVFELRAQGGAWVNGAGAAVDAEAAHVFPLLKARALHAGDAAGCDAVIVTQRRLNEPTDALAVRAPRLHAYLMANGGRIAARKSVIYARAPRFAMFGVGPYTFAPWKLAVAGFYARPNFRVVGPLAGRPVLVGDTAYFIPFDCEPDARAVAALLNGSAAQQAIAARVFPGKRPITKRLLDALAWRQLLDATDRATIAPHRDRLLALMGEGPVS